MLARRHSKPSGLWMVVLVMLGSLAAPSPATRKPADNLFEANHARWTAMSQSEQTTVRERYKSWKKMSAGDRKQVRENYQRFETYDADQRESLIQSHRKNFHRIKGPWLRQLRKRMQRMSQLNRRRRHQVQAVGWFLHAADGEGQLRAGAQMPRQRRRRMLRALGDIVKELRPEDRRRLFDLPPRKRRALIKRILREKHARFAKAFEEQYRDLHREIVGQLTPQERKLYQRLPLRGKLRLWKRASRERGEERIIIVRRMLQHFGRRLRDHRRKGQPRDRRK